MKIIYMVYTERCGETEGVFNEAGECIHYWWCNDANWRGEYFNPMFEELGIKILDSEREMGQEKYDQLVEKLLAKIKEDGHDFEDEEEEE